MTEKVRRLVVVYPNGQTKLFDESLQELDRGPNLLQNLLDSGWTLVRRSQAQENASTMILVEKEEGSDTVSSSADSGTAKPPHRKN